MQFDRVIVDACPPPFPIYADPVADLLRAHVVDPTERDPTVAHILGLCSGYSYADTATVAMMAGRLGLDGSACLRIAQTVDAMMIFSTAYLLQSRCGRVVIVCYRGTEPANLGNWLGDADVGSDSIAIGGVQLNVHSGFYRNVRATRWPVLESLHAAARGNSLFDSRTRLEHAMEALYITGHSLGGSMAALFALTLGEEFTQKLRAVYTFGQPLTVRGPLPEAARLISRKVFRHINARDIVPSLPPATWGPLEHFGHQYRFIDGAWQKDDSGIAQLTSFREIPRSLLAIFAPVRRRDRSRYTIADHGPHHYISALRPKGRITEFGDQG